MKPNLYRASGAFQPTAGMKTANTCVAVNGNARALVFSVADYGIVDDIPRIIPALTERVAELRG